jgi:hypothetical protein
MTVLTLISNVCDVLGLKRPTVLAGSSDKTIRRLLQAYYRANQEARRRYSWPQFTRRGTITLSTGVESYALPGDFHRFIPETGWDTNLDWNLWGPMSPQEWSYIKEGLISYMGPRQQFRVKGRTSQQFFVNPVPGASGNVLAFEYVSKSYVKPVAWAANTAYNVLGTTTAIVENNDIYYELVSGTTSGVTAPTHTSGDASDGGITWRVYNSPVETVSSNSDQVLLDDALLQVGTEYHFLEMSSFDYSARKADWETALPVAYAQAKSSRTLFICGTTDIGLITESNIPDTGYGA